MEIQQLRGFLAVARYKNFTLAAKKTLRTQPTISLQIKALEEELEAKLFERLSPGKVVLTPEGKLLLDLTWGLVEDFETVKDRFNELRGLYAAESVKVATHSSVMVYYLPEIIREFKQRFPDCHLTIFNRSYPVILEMISDGEVELGISSPRPKPDNIEYTPFSRVNRILIATKNHPLSEKKNITLKDIARYPLILPTKDSNTRQIVDTCFSQKGLSYNLSMEVVGREAIKTYVGMDFGISIMSEYFIADTDRDKLFIKNMSRYFGKSETGVFTRKGKRLSKPAQDFIELLFEKHELK